MFKNKKYFFLCLGHAGSWVTLPKSVGLHDHIKLFSHGGFL